MGEFGSSGRRALSVAAVVFALGLAACGSDDDADSSGGSAGGSSGGDASGLVAEAEKNVEAAKKGIPAAYEGPTEKVEVPKDITLAVMPCGGAVRGCVALTEGAAALGKQLGWKVREFDGKSTPNDQNAGILQATAAGADIILTGGTDPGAIKSGLAAARKKGIIVGSMSQGTTPTEDGYQFDINPEGPDMGRAAGDWMIADSDGKAVFQPWIDKEFAGAVQFLEGNIERVKECSTCEVLDNEEFVAASLTTDFGRRTVDKVRQNKDITYMNPSYDPAAAVQASALMTAGLKDRVKIASINGQKQNLELVKNGQVQAVDVAYDQEYVGWIAVYQALRLYNKQELVEVEGKDEYHVHGMNVPWRLFTADNVEEPIEEYSSDAQTGWKSKLGPLMGLAG